MAISLAGCGGSSTKASRDCFDVWNDGSNKAERSRVMGRFGVANVAGWRAEAANGTAKVEWRAGPSGATVTVNRGGPGNKGCGYLFHTSKRFLSISAEWKGKEIRWDVP